MRNILEYLYTYNSRGNLTQYRISNSASGTVDYTYDALERLSSKSFVSGSFSNTTSYTYSDKSSSTSPTQLKNYTVTVNGTSVTYKLYYDGFGNVDTVIYSTGETVYYTYDKLCQLIREDNELLGETYVYTYDKAGNIIKKETFALTSSSTTPTNPTATVNYTYGDSTWGDRLTAYDETPITYDSVGNPLTYYNGTSYTFTWTGRQLATATKGGVNYSFTYSDEGLRTSKTRGSYEVKYYYSNGLLIGESDNTQAILYIYDAEGSPLGMRYRKHTDSSGTWLTLWYEKNVFGDIVAIYSSTGTKVMSYMYDAWGNFTKRTHTTDDYANAAKKSPFLYRGYYYDSDLGFYVTGTRYYDPAIGRFINADSMMSGASGSLQGCNLYAYCFNNPIMYTDENGNWPSWNDVKEFFGNIFGASSSVEKTIVEEKTNILSFPSPIHITESYEKTQTLSEIGDSSKPLSVYSVLDADNVITSSAGFKVNIGDASLNINLAADDISVSGKVNNGNTTRSLGVKLNLAKLQLGFEGSISVQNGNYASTNSTNVSIDGASTGMWFVLIKAISSSGFIIPAY